ncbi:hypothetical protein FV229_10955 [Methylobacterium sp. WL120]|nr:hypothetical protein FV229_10955 [Methylobacterium sp. WL120]
MTRKSQDRAIQRGLPKTVGRGMLVGVRFHDAQLAPLDAWIADHPDPKPSRPAVIREAVAEHLRAKGYSK